MSHVLSCFFVMPILLVSGTLVSKWEKFCLENSSGNLYQLIRKINASRMWSKNSCPQNLLKTWVFLGFSLFGNFAWVRGGSSGSEEAVPWRERQWAQQRTDHDEGQHACGQSL